MWEISSYGFAGEPFSFLQIYIQKNKFKLIHYIVTIHKLIISGQVFPAAHGQNRPINTKF